MKCCQNVGEYVINSAVDIHQKVFGSRVVYKNNPNMVILNRDKITTAITLDYCVAGNILDEFGNSFASYRRNMQVAGGYECNGGIHLFTTLGSLQAIQFFISAILSERDIQAVNFMDAILLSLVAHEMRHEYQQFHPKMKLLKIDNFKKFDFHFKKWERLICVWKKQKEDYREDCSHGRCTISESEVLKKEEDVFLIEAIVYDRILNFLNSHSMDR